ncbi:MAG: redox-sensing transcriptional repressor Rex [candidate division KSB1 bacterium]|nr:redox-sensing transcriptional repressor Rex [candidate division KSB1 bacterium]
MVKLQSVSEATLRRLPQYLHLLKKMQENGTETVSTTFIAHDLNLDPTQVRKDLSVTQVHGKPRIGYQIQELIDAIIRFLNWQNATDALLVGAGSLGAALLGYNRMKNYGISIVAAFDNDRDKLGHKIHGKQILHIAKLPELTRRKHIHIGIITAPADAAQTIADLMVEGGIKAIWNFAPTALHVPEDIIVQRADIYSSLAILTKRLADDLGPIS